MTPRKGAPAVVRALPVSENALQGFVREVALLRGWRYYHTRDSRGSDGGFPDTVLARRPRLIFAELKTAGKNPTPAQAAWLGELEGIATSRPALEVYVWRPADLDEIQRILW